MVETITQCCKQQGFGSFEQQGSLTCQKAFQFLSNTQSVVLLLLHYYNCTSSTTTIDDGDDDDDGDSNNVIERLLFF